MRVNEIFQKYHNKEFDISNVKEEIKKLCTPENYSRICENILEYADKNGTLLYFKFDRKNPVYAVINDDDFPDEFSIVYNLEKQRVKINNYENLEISDHTRMEPLINCLWRFGFEYLLEGVE